MSNLLWFFEVVDTDDVVCRLIEGIECRILIKLMAMWVYESENSLDY